MRIAGPAEQLLGKAIGLFAGIDTHKDTLAVAVIDGTGRRRASEQLPNSEPGFVELVKLLEAHQVVRVGIEGAGNFGRAIAVHLALDWVPGAGRGGRGGARRDPHSRGWPCSNALTRSN